MSNVFVYTTHPNSTINEVIDDCILLADYMKTTVQFVFKDAVVLVNPGDTPEQVAKIYISVQYIKTMQLSETTVLLN